MPRVNASPADFIVDDVDDVDDDIGDDGNGEDDDGDGDFCDDDGREYDDDALVIILPLSPSPNSFWRSVRAEWLEWREGRL